MKIDLGAAVLMALAAACITGWFFTSTSEDVAAARQANVDATEEWTAALLAMEPVTPDTREEACALFFDQVEDIIWAEGLPPAR